MTPERAKCVGKHAPKRYIGSPLHASARNPLTGSCHQGCTARLADRIQGPCSLPSAGPGTRSAPLGCYSRDGRKCDGAVEACGDFAEKAVAQTRFAVSLLTERPANVASGCRRCNGRSSFVTSPCWREEALEAAGMEMTLSAEGP